MFKYSAKEVNKIANDTIFNKNICEKVLRLFSILNFINNSEFKDALALKGGTAINLFILNLPRLSIDIDLDFTLPLNKEELLSYRAKIDYLIRGFMTDEGYILSYKSKFIHTLDSYVYSYLTTSGSKNVLKIEINYSNRMHILKTNIKKSTNLLGETASINCLADYELIGSKINALLIRTTPRDIYDVYNIIKNMFILDSNDNEFINSMNNKCYNPNIIFKNYQIEDISNHPMALWKTR